MGSDDFLGRRVRDPKALRALAHAGRYAILQRLLDFGPATATECAEVAQLSPSACSYHLRLLARHGFVEPDDDPDRDRDRRERVWRATTTGWQVDHDPATDLREQQATDSTIARVMLASSEQRVLAFADQAASEPTWREAAMMSNSTILATADELGEISAALMAVLRPYFVSERPREEVPDGARPVHVALHMAPRPAPRPTAGRPVTGAGAGSEGD